MVFLCNNFKLKAFLGVFVCLFTVLSCSNQEDLQINTDSMSFKPIFPNGDSTYFSPVLYIIGENGTYINSVKTPVVFDESASGLQKFTVIPFKLSPDISDFDELVIVPDKDEKNSFCKNLEFTISNNNIIFPNSFSHLKTATSCTFHISSNSDQGNISNNTFTLVFNYSFSRWKSEADSSSEAKKTAQLITENNQNISRLYLIDSQIKDISPITDFTYLSALVLDNNLIETIPDSIENLNNLNELLLNDNKIAQLPESIGTLKNLIMIGLDKNSLTDLPSSFQELVNLKSLSIANNNLNKVPIQIKSLKNLRTLNLNNNKIEEIPEFLTSLTELKIIDLSNNNIKVIPKNIYDWLLLKKAVLENNPGFQNNFGN
jgi:Leucine-rich repeat (LRR) protein